MSGPSEPVSPNGEQDGTPAPRIADERARRVAERPLPLAGGALAGAGTALAMLGLIVWAGDYAVSGRGSDALGGSSSRTWLGIVLSLAAMVIGSLLAMTFRNGPLGTAGVTASALSTPTVLGFATFDTGDTTPINFTVVFVVSIVVWLLTYLVVPGARGHGIYLGLSALSLWAFVLVKISPNLLGLPFQALERAFAAPANTVSDPTRHLTALAVVSLILGSCYYLVAFLLDAGGRRGAATPFALAGFPALLAGMAFAAHPLGQSGTGVLFVVFGCVLVVCGGRARRRFTAWVWAAGVLYGVMLIVSDAVPHNRSLVGIAFIVVGAVIVLLGVSVTAALGEREYPST